MLNTPICDYFAIKFPILLAGMGGVGKDAHWSRMGSYRSIERTPFAPASVVTTSPKLVHAISDGVSAPPGCGAIARQVSVESEYRSLLSGHSSSSPAQKAGHASALKPMWGGAGSRCHSDVLGPSAAI